jgi:hypothetical protein
MMFQVESFSSEAALLAFSARGQLLHHLIQVERSRFLPRRILLETHDHLAGQLLGAWRRVWDAGAWRCTAKQIILKAEN